MRGLKRKNDGYPSLYDGCPSLVLEKSTIFQAVRFKTFARKKIGGPSLKTRLCSVGRYCGRSSPIPIWCRCDWRSRAEILRLTTEHLWERLRLLRYAPSIYSQVFRWLRCRTLKMSTTSCREPREGPSSCWQHVATK